MADVHTKRQRSYNMSKIGGFGTKPELKLKKFMKLLGFSYHPKSIIGNPDFADRKNKIAVFVDGCFWHKCPKHYIAPKNNGIFWSNKIKTNTKRDKKVNFELKKEGWRVIRIWEHSLRKI